VTRAAIAKTSVQKTSLEVRLTTDVLAELREKMDEVLRSYPSHIERVPNETIVGTAFFPGGCGLFCGLEHFGAAPHQFPESPIMFVAHNYASPADFAKFRARGGEAGSWWRTRILPLLAAAGIDPTEAFFTNALMGLKHGSSTGSMKAPPEFERACTQFLREQIRIVRPRAVVALGGDALPRVRRIVLDVVACLHPSNWDWNPVATRAERVAAQGTELRTALGKLRG
jgi:hypothetical protein